MTTEIFATHALAHWEPYPTPPRVHAVMADGWMKGRLTELLLQHDVVALPTTDFSLLPALYRWFGGDLLADILSSGALRFIRYYGSLAYHGDLKEIGLYELWPEKTFTGKPDAEHRAAAMDLVHTKGMSADDIAPIASTEAAAELYLTGIYHVDTGRPEGSALTNILRLVQCQTTEVVLDRDEFISEIVAATSDDIQSSKKLNEFILEETCKGLRDLDVVGVNETRVYRHFDRVMQDTDSTFDQVDLHVWLAMARFEIALARRAGSGHLLVPNPIRAALVGRKQRSGIGAKKHAEFNRLLEATNVPSVADSVAQGRLDIRDVWRLRESDSGYRFRKWFNEAIDEEDYADVRNAYFRAFSDSAPWLLDGSARTLRFLASTAIGLLDTQLGVATGAAGLLVGHLVRPWTPRLFIEELGRKVR